MRRETFARLLVAAAFACGSLAAQSNTPSPDDALAAKVRAELAAARKLPPALDRVVTPVIDRVWDGFDRDAAIDQVRFMDGYWRLPGNEGFDKSIDRVKTRLVAAGFKELPERPKTPITVPSLWIEPAPTPSLGWDQSKATLSIVRDGQPDQVVLSREKERLALAINSFSTAPGGIVAPLVDVGGGGSANDYLNKDVKGAVVVGTAGTGQLYTQAVVNRGAIGVVSTAKVPAYLDPSPDLLQWGSITYDDTRKPFGFRATPRAAETLKAATAAGAVKVRVDVVTSFARKPERTLAAEIPGATVPNERIVIAAHVQEPGANDNASGTATNMELTRALVMGVLSKKIPQPARTITFLWVNEISGSRRWLTEHADQKAGVKYMFSMDMTGEDITKTGGAFLIERWPDPGAVWARPWDPHTEWGASRVNPDTLTGDLINDFHMAMCERVAAKSMASVRRPWDVRSNPYEGGSDHTQFGSAGIPSILDWHFTDRFYHTNRDTAEKTSPDEMRDVGTAVAASAWLMASADVQAGAAVRELITKVGAARVVIETREGAVERAGVKPAENAQIVAAWRKWYDEAVASVSRLIVNAPAREPEPLADGLVPPQEDETASPTQGCDQIDMGPIPVTAVNVLWAADDRFFCTCASHTESHKEMRERELLFVTAPRSQTIEVRRAVALALGRLESPALTTVPLIAMLKDPAPAVRAEAVNALAQSAKTAADAAALVPEIAYYLYRPDPSVKPDWGMGFYSVPATHGMEQDSVASVMLESMARLPLSQSDAEMVARLLGSCAILSYCPNSRTLYGTGSTDARITPTRLFGIAKGFESLSRRYPKMSLPLDNVHQLATRGQQDFSRAPGAFDNRRTDEMEAELLAHIRRLAVQTLQNVGEKDKDIILKAANDGDWQVRRLGTMMLGALPLDGPDADDLVQATLDHKLKDQSFQVRLEAVKIAARLSGHSGDCSALLNATRDEQPAVAMQAIDGFGPACRDVPLILERLHLFADSLGDSLSTTSWQIGARALTALAKLAPAEAAPYLTKRELFESDIWQLRAVLASIAGRVKNEQLLLTFATDQVPNVRVAALDGLRASASTHLYEEALDALTSSDFQLIRTAATSLKGAPKDENTAMALMKTLKRLTDDGKDTSRDPRIALFERLTEQEPIDLLPLIKAHLTDFDPDIANAAKTLCERLVPGTIFTAEPRLRRPAQATLDDVRDLPKTAELVMKNGDHIELALNSMDEPMTVARVAALARAGYYNGLTFHRIVPNFVIQGGSPGASEYVGDARYMRDELGRAMNLYGAVGISTRGHDTGDAQIFIDLVDLPRLDHDYTVFAHVLSGMSAVDHILEGAEIATFVIR
jgi:cyclophilin family peptidyl-prolyl cis-trans isomerase/HEAT repeat protein